MHDRFLLLLHLYSTPLIFRSATTAKCPTLMGSGASPIIQSQRRWWAARVGCPSWTKWRHDQVAGQVLCNVACIVFLTCVHVFIILLHLLDDVINLAIYWQDLVYTHAIRCTGPITSYAACRSLPILVSSLLCQHSPLWKDWTCLQILTIFQLFR